MVFVTEYVKMKVFEMDVSLIGKNSGFLRNAFVKASDG